MFQLFSCGQKRFPATYGSPFQANIPFHPATAEQQQRIGQWQWQKIGFLRFGPIHGGGIDVSTVDRYVHHANIAGDGAYSKRGRTARTAEEC